MFQVYGVTVTRKLANGQYAVTLVNSSRFEDGLSKDCATAFLDIGTVCAELWSFNIVSGLKGIATLSNPNLGKGLHDIDHQNCAAQMSYCIMQAIADNYRAIVSFSPNGRHPGK